MWKRHHLTPHKTSQLRIKNAYKFSNVPSSNTQNTFSSYFHKTFRYLLMRPAMNILEIATLLHKTHLKTKYNGKPYKRFELSQSTSSKKTKFWRVGAHILWVYKESVMPWRWHSERGIFYNHRTKNKFPGSHISSTIKKQSHRSYLSSDTTQTWNCTDGIDHWENGKALDQRADRANYKEPKPKETRICEATRTTRTRREAGSWSSEERRSLRLWGGQGTDASGINTEICTKP